MPMLETLDADQPFAFQRPGKHDRWPIGRPAGGLIGCEEVRNAVSIDDQCLPAECFPASFVDFQIPLQHRWLTLTQSINVDRRAEIIEAVESRPLRCLPYRTLCRLAIAHQDINALIGILELFRINSDARS